MTISRYPHNQMCCFKQNIRVFGVRINVDVITFRIYNKIMKFEWDENKNEANIRKHGVDFNDIPEIFDGPMIINFDDRVDYNEERYMGIGVLRNIIAVVVFVEKGEHISDHQQSWGYEDGPWKGPRPPLLVAADF